MKNENQKTKEEIHKLLKTVIGKLKYAQMGTLDGLEFNMNDVIGKSEMMNNCRENIVELEKAEILLSEYATQSLPSSDAVEFAEWKDRHYTRSEIDGKYCLRFTGREWFTINQLYSIFLKEKGGKE